MGLYLGGLIIGRIFASKICGTYFWEGLFFVVLVFFWGGEAYYRNFMVVYLFNINLFDCLIY